MIAVLFAFDWRINNMRIIKIHRLRFPFSGETMYAFTQRKADSLCALFSGSHGEPVVDCILVPVDPYVPLDTSLDPSDSLVKKRKGFELPSVDTDGNVSDPNGYIPRWKAKGWNGDIEEEVIL